MIFAGTVSLSKMDLRANRGRESLQKLEVLREVFEQACVDREVLMERLAEGSYRDNLELLQWLKDLFDAQYPGPVAVPLEAIYAMAYNYPTSELYGYHSALHDCCYAEDNYEENYQTGAGGLFRT